MGADDDPLLLQIKEAQPSVLEQELHIDSIYRNHGERVVHGQRMMQATSDLFLGWSTNPATGVHYYWRQLHDMKGSANVPAMSPLQLAGYVRICGWALARAHARSGDAAMISGYLGSGDTFDRALVAFSQDYADQNERDYAAMVEAVRVGRHRGRGGRLTGAARPVRPASRARATRGPTAAASWSTGAAGPGVGAAAQQDEGGHGQHRAGHEGPAVAGQGRDHAEEQRADALGQVEEAADRADRRAAFGVCRGR